MPPFPYPSSLIPHLRPSFFIPHVPCPILPFMLDGRGILPILIQGLSRGWLSFATGRHSEAFGTDWRLRAGHHGDHHGHRGKGDVRTDAERRRNGREGGILSLFPRCRFGNSSSHNSRTTMWWKYEDNRGFFVVINTEPLQFAICAIRPDGVEQVSEPQRRPPL